MKTPFWFRIPHKKHCRYLINTNGVLMQVSPENYHNMEKIMGSKPSLNW